MLFGWVWIVMLTKSPAITGCTATTAFVTTGAGVAGELVVAATFAALPFAQGHVDEVTKGGEHDEGGVVEINQQ